jgi:hypothetical protein
MPVFRSPLATALGTAPDADASNYIASAGVTRLQQQIGINNLVAFLKAQSLWTTLAGGFLFGTKAGAKSGTSMPDIKGGTSATLTGGTFNENGILLNGATADKFSFGNRTFTNNYTPSAYVLFNYTIAATASNSHKMVFSPLDNNGNYRGFVVGHDGTGGTPNIMSNVYRYDGNRYYTDGYATNSGIGKYISYCFSGNDQKIYRDNVLFMPQTTTTTAAARTFNANVEWFLGCFLNNSQTSAEVTNMSSILFWDSNTTVTQTQYSVLDSIIKQIILT